MKLVNWKQSNAESRKAKFDATEPTRFNKTISPFLYKLWDGTKLFGVGTMIVLQVFGSPGYAQQPGQNYNMSEYLPSKLFKATAQIIYNQVTREYETHINIPMAQAQEGGDNLLKMVGDWLFSAPGNVARDIVTFDRGTWAVILGGAGTGVSLWGLGKLKAFKPEGKGGTFIFSGAMDKEALKSVLSYLNDQDYSAISEQAVKTKAELRYNEMSEKVNRVMEKNQSMFGASDFLDYEKMSYEQIKLIVEEKFKSISRQIGNTDPAVGSMKFALNAEAVLAPIQSKTGKGKGSSMTASLLASRLNNHVETYVEEFKAVAKTHIENDVKSKINMSNVSADATKMSSSFDKYVKEWVNSKKLGKGETAILEGTELGEVIGKTLYDQVPKNQRGGITQMEFVEQMKAYGNELGTLEFKRKGKFGGAMSKVFSRGGVRIAAGLVIGGGIWYLITPSTDTPGSGGTTNEFDNITAPNGIVLSTEQNFKLKMPGGEVRMGSYVFRNVAKPQKDYEFSMDDVKTYEIVYQDPYPEVAPNAKRHLYCNGASSGEYFYATPIQNGSFSKTEAREYTYTLGKAPPKTKGSVDPKTGQWKAEAYNNFYFGPQSNTPGTPALPNNYGNGLFEIGFEDGNITFGRHAGAAPEILGGYKEWGRYTIRFNVDIPNDSYSVVVMDAYNSVVAQKSGSITESIPGATFIANATEFKMMESVYVKGPEKLEELQQEKK